MVAAVYSIVTYYGIYIFIDFHLVRGVDIILLLYYTPRTYCVCTTIVTGQLRSRGAIIVITVICIYVCVHGVYNSEALYTELTVLFPFRL